MSDKNMKQGCICCNMIPDQCRMRGSYKYTIIFNEDLKNTYNNKPCSFKLYCFVILLILLFIIFIK